MSVVDASVSEPNDTLRAFERVDSTLDGEAGKAEVKRFCDAVCPR